MDTILSQVFGAIFGTNADPAVQAAQQKALKDEIERREQNAMIWFIVATSVFAIVGGIKIYKSM